MRFYRDSRWVARGLVGASVLLVASVGACASGERDAFRGIASEPETTEPGDGAPSPPPEGDFGDSPEQSEPPPLVHEVYGHSDSMLYKLEPATKTVTVLGKFDGCLGVRDIALDESSTLYAITRSALFEVDKSTLVCTKIATLTGAGASAFNALSFVPKGTVDPDEEALVTYGGRQSNEYTRINVKDGSTVVLGSLGDEFVPSGDIVSVKGGKSFLTVRGRSGGLCPPPIDCLAEIDPATGAIVRNWGPLGHASVYGLSFWGGSAYGFDFSGNLFEVSFDDDKLTVTAIAIPQKPADLSFWGAGSSTVVPLEPPGPK